MNNLLKTKSAAVDQLHMGDTEMLLPEISICSCVHSDQELLDLGIESSLTRRMLLNARDKLLSANEAQKTPPAHVLWAPSSPPAGSSVSPLSSPDSLSKSSMSSHRAVARKTKPRAAPQQHQPQVQPQPRRRSLPGPSSPAPMALPINGPLVVVESPSQPPSYPAPVPRPPPLPLPPPLPPPVAHPPPSRASTAGVLSSANSGVLAPPPPPQRMVDLANSSSSTPAPNLFALSISAAIQVRSAKGFCVAPVR